MSSLFTTICGGYAAHSRGAGWIVCALLLLAQGSGGAEERVEFIPLPDDAMVERGEPVSSAAEAAIQTLSKAPGFQLPDSMVIHNENGQVEYDQEKKTINYVGDGKNCSICERRKVMKSTLLEYLQGWTAQPQSSRDRWSSTTETP